MCTRLAATRLIKRFVLLGYFGLLICTTKGFRTIAVVGVTNSQGVDVAVSVVVDRNMEVATTPDFLVLKSGNFITLCNIRICDEGECSYGRRNTGFTRAGTEEMETKFIIETAWMHSDRHMIQ